MSKYHYRLLIDSRTGKKLTNFWKSCVRCEREAERYAKKMGGQYYYENPKYFAGGVSFISFPDNKPSDPKMWHEVGTVYEDGEFVSAQDKDYKGAQVPGDTVYFEPNVRKRIEWVELPTKDFRPADTFDCIHSAIPPIERDGKWWIQCCHFIYDEPPGRSGNGQRIASRTVRRAIKAEVQREKLPVMRVEPLLDLLGADLQPKPAGKADGGTDGGVNGRATTVNPTKSSTTTVNSTPTFFAFEHHYLIGCDYECRAEGLVEITPQQYRTYQCRFENQAKTKAS